MQPAPTRTLSPARLRRVARALAPALAALACAALLSGCVVGGHMGNHQTGPLGDSAQVQQISQERQALTIGTTLDFRAARFTSALEMLNISQEVQTQGTRTVSPSEDDSQYTEHRLFRIDVPALSLWDFENNSVGYPGMIPWRHTIDLWGRGGMVSRPGQQDFFAGGALTYYRSRAFAVSLAVDYWNSPMETRVSQASGEGFSSYNGRAEGWMVGFEITIAAGEYPLQIFQELFEMDQRHQENLRRGWGPRVEGGDGFW